MTDHFPTLPLTDTQRSRLLATIAACERFIAKHRDTELPHVQQHLDFCKQHRTELMATLMGVAV